MNANVSKLLNEQINKEFYSAYLYLDFANYYAAVGLDGFENWYRMRSAAFFSSSPCSLMNQSSVCMVRKSLTSCAAA